MPSERAGDRTSVRYEPDDKPPTALTFGLGLQLAILCLSGIVLTPAIVVRAAGSSETYLAWAVFAAVAVSGVTTVLQAVRVGRIGAGYVLLMGTSGAFIAVSVTALAQGGPAMLATLVVISALFQFVLAARLSLLRRVLTPTVAGTVIMLIAVTVMPIVFDTLKDVLFDQHRGDRAHRGRSAQRRGGHRGDLRGAGVPAQGARRGAGDSGAGGRGLHHRAAGDAVRHRDEDGGAGRHRLPQGTGGRCFVLGRSRLPERRGVPGVLLAGGRRAAAERHDGRRSGGHPDDAVHGADRASPPPDRGGDRPLGPAEDQGVPGRIRVAQRLGRGDGRAARRRRRGDAAVARRSGRGRRAARTAAAAAGGPQAGWRGRPGVRRLQRAREPAGPDRAARPAFGRGSG